MHGPSDNNQDTSFADDSHMMFRDHEFFFSSSLLYISENKNQSCNLKLL